MSSGVARAGSRQLAARGRCREAYNDFREPTEWMFSTEFCGARVDERVQHLPSDGRGAAHARVAKRVGYTRRLRQKSA